MAQTAILQPTEVPHESLRGTYALGACAYHRDGIARVEFKLTDGVAYTETNTVTSRSNYTKHLYTSWCYNTSFDLSNFADGQVTVQITAVPTSGTNKVMSYSIHNNDGNTFNPRVIFMELAGDDSWDGSSFTRGTGNVGPKRTLDASIKALSSLQGGDPGGGFILMGPGVHKDPGMKFPFPTSTRSWVTITARPGFTWEQVMLNASVGGIHFKNIAHLKFKDIWLYAFPIESGTPGGSGKKVWFDGCVFNGGGSKWQSNTSLRWAKDYEEMYYSRCAARWCKKVFVSATMIRDCSAEQIAEDCIFDPGQQKPRGALILNCTFQYLRQGGPPSSRTPGAPNPNKDTSVHADGVQLFPGINENIIVCGLRIVDAEGLQCILFNPKTINSGFPTFTNIAFENVFLTFIHGSVIPSGPSSQFSEPNTHVIFRHITVDQNFLLRESVTGGTPYIATECEISNSVFQRLYVDNNSRVDTDAEMRANTNHFILNQPNSTTWGTKTGDAKFRDQTWPKHDARPGTGSPLLATGTQSHYDLPPGPKGVGTVATPNIGAWGDAAGLGFSKTLYEATPKDVNASVAMDIPIPTQAASTSTTNLVSVNLPLLIGTMQWEPTGGAAVKCFTNPTPWPVPGTDPRHLVVSQFFVHPDGRCLRVIARTDTSEDYLDFWFTHFWGHTRTSQVTWNKTLTPGKVTINGKSFFEWGDKLPVAVSNWFAHGHAVQDRIRIRFSAYNEWTTEDVTQQAPLFTPTPPFESLVPPPVWCTDKTKTLDNEIGYGKKSKSAWWSTAYGSKRAQFIPSDYVIAQPNPGGDHENYGTSHLDVALWALPGSTSTVINKYDTAWYNTLKKCWNPTGNWIHPNGDVVDTKSSDYDELVMWDYGWHENSFGYDKDLKKQNWFNQHAVTGSPYNWMSRTPDANNQRWRQNDRAHMDYLHVAQYFHVFRDPGTYLLILQLVDRLMASYPTENRGNSAQRPSAQRGRGRHLMSAAAFYKLTGDTRLLTHMKGRIDLEYAQFSTSGAVGTRANGFPRILPGSGNDDNGIRGYSIWYTGIWMSGLIAVSQNRFNLGTVVQNKVEEMLLEGIRRTLLCFKDQGGGVWHMAYINDALGAPVSGTNSNFSGWFWCLHSLMWVKQHPVWYAKLDGDEQDDLDGIYAYRYTNFVGADGNKEADNVWPEEAEYLYHNGNPQVTGGNTIPVPKIVAMADVDTSGIQVTARVDDMSIPIPTIAASAEIMDADATGAIKIPVPTIAAKANSQIALRVIGNVFDMAIPIPTISASAKPPDVTVGNPDDPDHMAIPIPTIAATMQQTFDKNAETRHTGDGSTTYFEIGFEYLHWTHLSVYVNSVLLAEGDWAVDSSGLNVEIGDAPGSGLLVQIKRTTPHPDPYIVFSPWASVTSDDASRAWKQAIYYAEEIEDQL